MGSGDWRGSNRWHGRPESKKLGNLLIKSSYQANLYEYGRHYAADKHLSFGGATGWHGPQTLPIHAPSVAGAVDKQCYDFGRRESLAGGSGACLARNESGMRELCLRLTLKR